MVPGAAGQILTIFSDQTHHRMEQEAFVLRADARRADRGQLAAFIIALAFLAVAGLLIFKDHDLAGTCLGTVDITALASVFIYGAWNKRSEREDRAKMLAAANVPRRQ